VVVSAEAAVVVVSAGAAVVVVSGAAVVVGAAVVSAGAAVVSSAPSSPHAVTRRAKAMSKPTKSFQFLILTFLDLVSLLRARVNAQLGRGCEVVLCLLLGRPN
jgi:hypothetical protein